MKFSVFSVSLPEWDAEDAVRELARQGWDGIEWRVVDQEPAQKPGFWTGNRATIPFTGALKELPRAARLARDEGLEVSGVGSYVLCSDRDGVDSIFAAVAEAGVDRVRITVPKLGPAPYPELFDRSRADWEHIERRAAAFGITALLEIHHGTIVASASAACRLVDGLDPARIGVIHDLGNMLIEGHEDFLAAFQMLGPYLRHIHVKNGGWRPSSANGAPWEFEWMPLRSGQGDLAAYFRALTEFGYQGWVTVEDFSVDEPLEERTRGNLAYLRQVSEQASGAGR